LVAEWLITKTSASRRAVMSREEGFWVGGWLNVLKTYIIGECD
jgi:hypothetical protein